MPIQPIYLKNGPDGLNWQCCLAVSSKTAPRILIFSIAIDVDYSYDVKNSEICAPAFFKHNNSFIATVNAGADKVDLKKSHCEKIIFDIFLQSPHQVNMKNVVEYWK